MNKDDLALYVGEKIKKLRLSRGMTQEDLAELLDTTKQSIGRYENGTRKISQDLIFELADIFKCSINDFFPKTNQSSSIETIYNQLNKKRQVKVYNFAEYQLKEQNKKVVPLVGSTAANPQVLAYADPLYETTVNTNVPECADCALVVRGNSMETDYMDGSIVFYKRQNSVENGELAIVEIDGDGVTFKKVIFDYDNQQVILRSLNSEYEDRVLKDEEYKIVGKVVK